MKSRYIQKTAKPGRTRTARTVTLPAPVNGWVTSESMLNAAPASAQILDNWIPTSRGIRMRGGSRTVATISASGAPVVSLISYNAPNMKRLFAASASQIFDVTAVGSPTVPPDAAVSGQTSGYYSFVNFTTSGGQYLTAVNGTDPLLLYHPIDGWKPITDASTPAITGAPTSILSHVWVYKNRQFFIQANTLVANYLPVGSIAGALGTVDMNGVFQRGGALVFGGTWSMYAGDGLDDKCVFVTDQGEVAIYQGNNPNDPAGFTLVGRYDITPPLGKRATMRAGGDLVIATEEGVVPISAAINKDPAALNIAAISRPIEPEWRKMAVARRALPWEIIKVPRKGYAIVSVPVTSAGQEPIAFVVSTETGKWCRFTNWDARCMVLHGDDLYFGTSDGKVKQAEVSGSDDGAGIYYTLVSNPDYLGDRSSVKNVLQARATFMSSTPFNPKVSVSMDFKVDLPDPPDTADDVEANEWDAGNWDQAEWDASRDEGSIQAKWISIGRTGYVMQYQIQATGALTPSPDTEFISLDVTFEPGGVVV